MGDSTDWQIIARELAERLPASQLDRRAIDGLDAAPDVPWVVACSGGADSVAALLLAWTHWTPMRPHLHVAHFNHCLRGAASDGDAAFVEGICRALGLVCHLGHWQSPPPQVSESDARDARREFLARVCAETGATRIVTGHHLDDVAETLVMRVGRGSGMDGLCAPRPVSAFCDGIKFIRPLLTLRKEALCRALEAAGATWREDATNAQGTFTRNRVRNEVMPLLDDALARPFAAGAARVRQLLEEADDALVWVAKQVLEASESSGVLRLHGVRQQPRGIVRRVLELWLEHQGLRAGMGAAAFDALLDELLDGRRLTRRSIAKGFIEEDATGRLRHEPPAREAPAYRIRLTPGTITFFGWARLTVDRYLLSGEQRDRILSGRIDQAKESWLSVAEHDLFEVRTWIPGDQYQPLGMQRRSKLQDQFVNRKVPVRERSRLPVVTVGGVIAWCPGLPPAENFRISEETRSAVRLTYLAS